MRSEFRKLRDNGAPPRDRGTVDKFAGQSPKMWDAWQLCNSREDKTLSCLRKHTHLYVGDGASLSWPLSERKFLMYDVVLLIFSRELCA